ncbi:Polymer-forming protein [Bacteroidales bacterium WCE2008]|nr:Polymer-forming protein [Bacteroidales bacterium WCE2008]
MAKTMEQSVNVNEVSRISTGTSMKGEINSPNDIRIDGSFDGKIISKGRVVIGDKAVISGDIICDNVDFWGKMTGSLYVRDTLALKDGCVVNGDLHVKRLSVELGARFEGNCKMLKDGEFEKVAGEVSAAAPASASGAASSAASSPVHSSSKSNLGGVSLK